MLLWPKDNMKQIYGGVFIKVMANLEINVHSKYLSQIQEEVIYGGYFAALCGPAFVISVSFMVNFNVCIPLVLITYLIPLIVYSYDYYQDMDKDLATNTERSIYFFKRSGIYPYIMGGYTVILAFLLVFFSNIILISFILILVALGVLYTVALKDFTRKLPAFKNIYTALTWSLAGTFFIPFYYSLNISWAYIMIFLFVFLKCLSNIIFFDLKDIKSDRNERLKTIPMILGKEKTLKLLQGLNILAFIPLFTGIFLEMIPLFTVFMFLFYFYSMNYLKKAEHADDKIMRMVSYTLVDAEFVLWPMVLLVGKLILF